MFVCVWGGYSRARALQPNKHSLEALPRPLLSRAHAHVRVGRRVAPPAAASAYAPMASTSMGVPCMRTSQRSEFDQSSRSRSMSTCAWFSTRTLILQVCLFVMTTGVMMVKCTSETRSKSQRQGGCTVHSRIGRARRRTCRSIDASRFSSARTIVRHLDASGAFAQCSGVPSTMPPSAFSGTCANRRIH